MEEKSEQSVSVADQMCRVVVSHVIDPWNIYIRKFTFTGQDPLAEVESAIEFAVIEGEISEKCPPDSGEFQHFFRK